jgi:hypothetical protein
LPYFPLKTNQHIIFFFYNKLAVQISTRSVEQTLDWRPCSFYLEKETKRFNNF